MADDPKKRGMSDRTRINLEQDYEVREAMNTLGVSREELEAAVKKVGNQRADVEAELRRAKGR
jgi:Holliday junction resolvasome RuvABC DNA-binding subunit